MIVSRPRFGLVGAGYWGANLIRNCEELGVLVSVCDVDDSKLASLRSRYHELATTTDYSAMLKGPVDAVVIAAPAQLHARLAIEAISAGKHVFIEKPLALTVPDAEAVMKAAEDCGIVVSVGHVVLYHPAVRELLNLLRAGAIGDLWHVRSRRLSFGKLRAHENVWWSFAPHDVALMLELFQESPEYAEASALGRAVPGISDLVYADYVFSSDRSAHIEVGWLEPSKAVRLDVFGTRGVLTLEDFGTHAALTRTPCEVRPGSPVPELWRGQPEDVAFPSGEPLKIELQAFIEAIMTNSVPVTSVRHGVEVVRTLAMADLSSNSTSGLSEVLA